MSIARWTRWPRCWAPRGGSAVFDHAGGKTISEQILSRASHSDARAGDLVICDVDVAMGTDGLPLPAIVLQILDEGGLVPYFRRRHDFSTP